MGLVRHAYGVGVVMEATKKLIQDGRWRPIADALEVAVEAFVSLKGYDHTKTMVQRIDEALAKIERIAKEVSDESN